MTAIKFNDLLDVSYHSERVRARRLARTSGIPTEQALRQILEAAGDFSLPELIERRIAAKLQLQEKSAARRLEKTHAAEKKRAAAQPDASAWLAWFDGSAKPNPGKMGIGGLLKSPDGQIIEISCAAGHGDSNEAEYLALIAVLETALRAAPAQLVIHGDSRVVIDHMLADEADAGAQDLHRYRLHAKNLLSQLGQVSLRWVPRHKNTAADALSQRANTNAFS